MKTIGPRYLGGLLIAVALAAIVAVSIGLPYSQSESDCASCHQPETDVVAEGVHASTQCVSCHSSSDVVGRLRFGGAVVVNMRLRIGDATTADAVSIPNERCESCHDVSEGVTEGAVRINHSACAATDRCTRCHDAVVHGPDQQLVSALDMFDCLRCHSQENQTLACDACHVGRLPRERVRTGTFAVTHGPEWRTNHGLGSVSACTACHEPQDCSECHGAGVPHVPNFRQSHGDYAQDPGAACTSCHLESYCSGCHTVEMPHPPGFKNAHAQLVRDDGDESCKTCHGGDDCVRCHVLHVHPGGAVGGGRR